MFTWFGSTLAAEVDYTLKGFRSRLLTHEHQYDRARGWNAKVSCAF